MEQTSWNGIKTRALQKRMGGKRGFYTRYYDREKRDGLQIVRNRDNANFVYNLNGELVKIEPKYHHYTSNDPQSVKTYNQRIKRSIELMVKRNQSYKNKVIKHGD